MSPELPRASVLIVDDTPDRLDLLIFIMRQAGYGVLEARDGMEAFQVARATSPDLIISDVSMPDINGIDLCRLIRAEEALESIPILLVSAIHRDSHTAIAGLTSGADDYIEAPYDPVRLVAKAERLLARRRSEQALRQSAEWLWQSEMKYRMLVEQASDGILVLDREGRILEANDSACATWGYGYDEFRARWA